MTDHPVIVLGQSVRLSEYLVRASLTAKQVIQIADAWPDFPEQVLDHARRVVTRERRESPDYRVWVPGPMAKGQGPWGGFGRGTRHHPEPWDLQVPIDGIIVQQVQVQDGLPSYDENGASWNGLSSRVGFRVAYHLNRRSVLALPAMIVALP